MKAASLLRMARRRAGVTQRELARRSSVPQPTISRIESGRTSPSVDLLDRLLQAGGMTLEALERGGDVDRSLVRKWLSMSVAERGRRAVQEWNRSAVFRRAPG